MPLPPKTYEQFIAENPQSNLEESKFKELQDEAMLSGIQSALEAVHFYQRACWSSVDIFAQTREYEFSSGKREASHHCMNLLLFMRESLSLCGKRPNLNEYPYVPETPQPHQAAT